MANGFRDIGPVRDVGVARGRNFSLPSIGQHRPYLGDQRCEPPLLQRDEHSVRGKLSQCSGLVRAVIHR